VIIAHEFNDTVIFCNDVLINYVIIKFHYIRFKFMTYFKCFILLIFLSSICHAEPESIESQDQWIDMESMEIWQDSSIQYITRVGKIIPTVTFLEIKNGQLAVVLSLNTPGFLKNPKEWTEDFRVIYRGKDTNRELGELDGFSFNIPNDQWITSLTFLPPENMLKKDITHVIIQAKKTKLRLAHLDKLKQDKVERERLTDEMMPNVPFPVNTLGRKFDFELKLHDGNIFNSKLHRGKIILLDFWSWNCGPCRRAIPKLQELIKKHPDNKFEIIGINFDDYEIINEILTEQKITWSQWVVKEEYMQLAVYKKLKFNGIPYYMLIDQTGTLVKQGYTQDVDLINDIKKLLD